VKNTKVTEQYTFVPLKRQEEWKRSSGAAWMSSRNRTPRPMMKPSKQKASFEGNVRRIRRQSIFSRLHGLVL
jgi:hypothetical protein